MKLSNYSRPTPIKLKILGDLSISMIPILSAAIPTAPINEAYKYWILLALNCSLVAFKFFTKLYSDSPQQAAA